MNVTYTFRCAQLPGETETLSNALLSNILLGSKGTHQFEMSTVCFVHISCDFLVFALITGSMKYEEIIQLALDMIVIKLFPPL